MPLDDVFAYFRAYDHSTFQVVACQGNEPSESDIETFEQLCGRGHPDFFHFATCDLSLGAGGLGLPA